jgi:hypothetical protein
MIEAIELAGQWYLALNPSRGEIDELTGELCQQASATPWRFNGIWSDSSEWIQNTTHAKSFDSPTSANEYLRDHESAMVSADIRQF